MTTITAYGLERLSFDREPSSDGSSLVLRLEAEDGTTIEVHCGHFADDAEAMAVMLSGAASEAATVVTGWVDEPEEWDGYVTADREGYSVSLEGKHLGTYPTRDRAEYELARAMSQSGYFPNTWVGGEHGPVDIELDLSRWFDEAGDTVVPEPEWEDED